MESFSFYVNSGLPWMEEETKKMLQEYDAGLDIIEIGRIHKRTPGGIAHKLKSLDVVYPMSAARGYEKYKTSALYYEIVKTLKTQKEERQKYRKMKQQTQSLETIEIMNLKDQISQMYNEVQNMKKSLSDVCGKMDTVVKLMKLIYEFENE